MPSLDASNYRRCTGVRCPTSTSVLHYCCYPGSDDRLIINYDVTMIGYGKKPSFTSLISSKGQSRTSNLFLEFTMTLIPTKLCQLLISRFLVFAWTDTQTYTWTDAGRNNTALLCTAYRIYSRISRKIKDKIMPQKLGANYRRVCTSSSRLPRSLTPAVLECYNCSLKTAVSLSTARRPPLSPALLLQVDQCVTWCLFYSRPCKPSQLQSHLSEMAENAIVVRCCI